MQAFIDLSFGSVNIAHVAYVQLVSPENYRMVCLVAGKPLSYFVTVNDMQEVRNGWRWLSENDGYNPTRLYFDTYQIARAHIVALLKPAENPTRSGKEHLHRLLLTTGEIIAIPPTVDVVELVKVLKENKY